MKFFITGANRGLGLSLTKISLLNGHTVFAGVRGTEEAKIKELLELKETYNENLEIIEIDVQSEDSVLSALAQLKGKTDSIDVLINNAAILNERGKSIEELDMEACRLAFDINILGPIRVVKHFLPLLEKGANQSILNISSEAASLTNSYSGDYAYGISKAALNMLSEKLHCYLRDQDIQVLSIHPGWMKTDMGGENAPLYPMDTGKGIVELAERKKKITSPYVFVDYNGDPMKI
ncbi:NAD(P)-dependent dehydrogenase (short-subunit alcohol dehydrogenase family) [Evansella vedderi]|uniref:NAD(P)-dependent dehydrogenase (Short-subunit alcohol dehydrogenase family) n=1 Tax=Evansella vedderi TaxID=38282 RepID=A0ABT9ZQG8_9BACI|nr:SDR family oxidoreductase [Evansella vedderi]MDQ0252972.1 NAD(P)-dependent dehydrogenase (short-subunit alcohol dehydrogenase family) [Evansella vedderi]